LGGNLTTTGAATPTLAFGATGHTYTYPTSDATLAGVNVAETFTAQQSFQDVTSSATLGSDLLSGNGTAGAFTGWSSGTGWATSSASGVWTVGTSGALTQSVAVTNGTSYVVQWDQTNSVANNGTIKVTIGTAGTSIVEFGNTSANTGNQVIILATGVTGSQSLAFTGTSDLGSGNVTITNITIKALTHATPALNLRASNGGITAQIWSGGINLNNIAYGNYSLQSNTTGSLNVGIGTAALSSNTTGQGNIGIGYSPLSSNTVGAENLAFGYVSLYNNLSGTGNVGVGGVTLTSITTGNYNVALGYATGNGIVTGSYNTILGANVSGLAAGLSNSVILADGTGRIALQSTGQTTTVLNDATISFPNVTTAAAGASSAAFGTAGVSGHTTVAGWLELTIGGTVRYLPYF
jgi:hypothetical protein